MNKILRSFVILKNILEKRQKDMILNHIEWIKFFIDNDATDEKFKNYENSNWNVKEYSDYIFGEASELNFDISDFLNFISIDKKYIIWDDSNTPSEMQLSSIDFLKKEYNKVENVVNTTKNGTNIKKDYKPTITSDISFRKSKPNLNGINNKKSNRHEKKNKR